MAIGATSLVMNIVTEKKKTRKDEGQKLCRSYLFVHVHIV